MAMELVETRGFACLDCGRAWPRRPNTSVALSGKKQSIICAVCHKSTQTEARIMSAKCGKCEFVWTPSARKTTERVWIRCRKCNRVFVPTTAEMRKLQRVFIPETGKYMDLRRTNKRAT